MTGMSFQRATKRQRRARVFLAGPSGSGKTWTALTWATRLAERVALIDTEHSTALAYAGDFAFDHLDLHPPFTVGRYIAAMNVAADQDYGALVIDSTSHAWAGKGGLLELVDNYKATHRGDGFSGWQEASPLHQEFIEALLAFPGHLICTARAKQDYQLQQNDRGRWEPVKLGLAPVQREGLDYEFDVVCEMSVPENVLRVTKTRCSLLAGFEQVKPDEKLALTLLDWLTEGAPIPPLERPTVADVVERAQQLTGVEELRALFTEAEQHHLLPSSVLLEDGSEVSLGEFIRQRGIAARARQSQQSQAQDGAA